MTQRIEVLAAPEALAERVADWLVQQATARQGPVSLALSGGSTPKLLYRTLAAMPWRDRMPWEHVHVFWGDERFVAANHPDSNQGMARQALLAHVPILPSNIHPMPVEGTPEEAAGRYEATLRAFAASRVGKPLFDVQLLGLGPDGHTASLFPGTPALEERSAWVAAVIDAKPEPRITLTYPALNNSREVAFLVAGSEKREALRRLRTGDRTIPAAVVDPPGTVLIFADRLAAEP